jgi:nucleoredoxin
MSKFAKLFGEDGATVLGQGGATVDVASFKGKVTAIYFSAHWCPPCKAFTPELVKFYKNMVATGREFEVVFASSDRSKEQFDEYFGEMPWLAFPMGDARIGKASAKFKVAGIPTLVILDGEGNVITKDGRAGVSGDPQGADFPWKAPSIEDVCGAIKFQSHDGTTKSWADLKKNKAVAFYFSAHWCGPCRAFTPQLIKTYNKMKADGKPFEVVFASSDHDNSSFEEYWGSMPWMAVPFADKAAKAGLDKVFPHRGIPTLYIVDPAAGKVITDSGRGKIMGDKNGDNFPWLPQPVEQLGDGPDVNSTAIVTLLVDNAADTDAADASIDALKAFGKAKKAEWEAKGMEEDEFGVDFGFGDEECGLVAPIRSFTSLTKTAPVLFVLDVPARAKYMWSGSGYPTKDDIAAFTDAYLAGSLTKVGIKDPVA